MGVLTHCRSIAGKVVLLLYFTHYIQLLLPFSLVSLSLCFYLLLPISVALAESLTCVFLSAVCQQCDFSNMSNLLFRVICLPRRFIDSQVDILELHTIVEGECWGTIIHYHTRFLSVIDLRSSNEM